MKVDQDFEAESEFEVNKTNLSLDNGSRRALISFLIVFGMAANRKQFLSLFL